MSIPSTPAEWIWLVVNALILLAPPSLVFVLFRMIMAHSVYLYGQRTSDKTGPSITYRFAIQNNEDVALFDREELKLSIKILDTGGAFLEAPGVYAGSTVPESSGFGSNKKNEWSMSVRELLAYDTWAFDCVMNRFSRNVEFSITTSSIRLTANELLLHADRNSKLVGRTKTPEWWWALGAILLALTAFALIPVLSAMRLAVEDWPYMLAITVFGIFLFLLSPRSAPPITQGYADRVIHSDRSSGRNDLSSDH